MSGVLRKTVAGLALGALTAALVLTLAAAGYFDIAELKLYDWRMRQAADPASVDGDIALVEINDTTIRDLQPLFGHWPWPRLALSYVIDFLHRAPARVVAVDVILAEPDRVAAYDVGGQRWSGSESDKALADSVKASGNVIMLADAVNEGTTTGAADARASHWRAPAYALDGLAEHRPVILPPYQSLTDASAALGHNFLALDRDGPARRMAPFVENGGQYLPSLGVAARSSSGAAGFRSFP
jgi:adenylate cyclase